MEYLTAENIDFSLLTAGKYSTEGKVSDKGAVSNKRLMELFRLNWNYYVIDLITEGKAIITTNGVKREYKPGEINLRKPGDITQQDPYCVYTCIYAHIKIKKAGEESDENAEYSCILDSLPENPDSGNFDYLVNLCMDLQRYAPATGECAEYFKKQLALRIIAELCEGYAGDGLPKSKKYNTRINKAIDYIESNINFERISIDELAEISGLSPKYFQRAFKEATGATPAKYMLNRKMELSIEYVTGNRYTITEIADIFGFQNVSYFIRKFKEYYGKTPAQYRNGYKK